MLTVKLSDVSVETIRSEVIRANDSEICGFLLGNRSAECLYVATVRPAENLYHSRTGFAISQSDYDNAWSAATDRLAVVGLYHSHYGSAHLSCLDRHNIALTSLVWLVVGLRGGVECSIAEWRC